MYSEIKEHTQEEWYKILPEQGKYIADLIFEYHYNYKKKDKKFRYYVYLFKISIFFFAMCNTIILGVNFFSEKELQINIGLIVSAVITFFTTLSSFFNFEQYWMRNIVMHIEMIKIKNNFVYHAKNNEMNDKLMKNYLEKLNDIQNKDIKYWKKSMLKNKINKDF